MKLIRNAIAAGAIAAVSLAACSSQHGDTTGGAGAGNPTLGGLTGQSGDTGSIKAALTIAGGSLYSLNYTCTGPSVIPAGKVDFNDAQSVEWVLGGIVSGTGYTCVLTGTDSNGDLCSGTTSSFNILPGQISGASVLVTCNVATDASSTADVNTGSAFFDASVQVVNQGAYACPGINSFSISPAEVIGSQPSQLGLSEIGPIGLNPDGTVATSDIIWTATCATPPCGTFGPSNTAASPTFTCGPLVTDQIVTIKAQVTNYEKNITSGIVSDVCLGAPFTTMTSTIDCEGGGVFSCAGTPSTPNACPGNVCVNFLTNVNNCGACAHACTGATPNCSAGTCVAAPPPPAGGPCTQLVGGVLKDATGNTACIKCDQNANGVCSDSEAVIVTRDQAKGLLNAAKTAPSAASCYECAVTNGLLDSDLQGFSGEECASSGLTGAALQSCLTALNCYVGSPQTGTAGATGSLNPGVTAASLAADCSNQSTDGVFNCFCGTAESDVSDCKLGANVAAAATGGLGVASPNGACITQILAGTGLTTSAANSTVITDMSSGNFGAGEAATMLQNFGSNSTTPTCSVCFK